MRVLLKTNYTGSFDGTSDLTHVLVDDDPRHQLDMRARLSDVLALPQVDSVTFFDWSPQPVLCQLDRGIDGDAPAWFDEDTEVVAIPDEYSPPAAELGIAASTVRYMPDGLMWCFYETHGGELFETVTIPWEFIAAAAKEKGGQHTQVSR